MRHAVQGVDFEQGMRVHHGDESAADFVCDVVHAHLFGDLKLIIADLLHGHIDWQLLGLLLNLELLGCVDHCRLS